MECKDEVERGLRKVGAVGKYIGESSRTLAERSVEHCRGATSIDPDNFIVKHWVMQHSDMDRAPRVQFKVVKVFKDPLSRLVAESVLIDNVSNLNSKSEWRNNKMSRLVVEVPSWMSDKKENDEANEAFEFSKKVEELRARKEVIKTDSISVRANTGKRVKVPVISKQYKRGHFVD